MAENCQLIEVSQTRTTIVAHIRGSMKDFDQYSGLFEKILQLNDTDKLVLYLNTPGGDCSIGFSIAHAVLGAKCKVETVVEYPTCSMGAIIALCGDSILMYDDTYLMFHDYSGGILGKGEETWQHTDNYRKIFKSKFDRICRPFLSAAECSKMFKGEDIYIHNDDPTLETRIKRHFK